MVAGQGSLVYFNSFLAGHFFFSEIDWDGVSLCQGEPAVGGDHQVMCSDDLGVDDEFGFEVAGIVVDGGEVGAGGRDGYSAALVPGLDDEYGIGGVDGGFVVEDDGVGDAFGDYFVGGKFVAREVGAGGEGGVFPGTE